MRMCMCISICIFVCVLVYVYVESIRPYVCVYVYVLVYAYVYTSLCMRMCISIHVCVLVCHKMFRDGPKSKLWPRSGGFNNDQYYPSKTSFLSKHLVNSDRLTSSRGRPRRRFSMGPPSASSSCQWLLW